MRVRLQKHIADLGICSRRKAEELIRLGNVRINGEVITAMGTKIDPEKDRVRVVGHKPADQRAVQSTDHLYIALHKPVDYITSASSHQGASVMDLLTKENNIGRYKKDIRTRVYPVGRLDKDSEGLILLTNDGDLTNTLTHPRYAHEKEYEVTIDEPLTRDAKHVLCSGMKLDRELVDGITIARESNRGKRSVVTVILRKEKTDKFEKCLAVLAITYCHSNAPALVSCGSEPCRLVNGGVFAEITLYNSAWANTQRRTKTHSIHFSNTG